MVTVIIIFILQKRKLRKGVDLKPFEHLANRVADIRMKRPGPLRPVVLPTPASCHHDYLMSGYLV